MSYSTARTLFEDDLFYTDLYKDQPFNHYVINFIAHQALSLSLSFLGYEFFCLISLPMVYSVYASMLSLLLTTSLAALLAFPLAVEASRFLAKQVDHQDQQIYFLALAFGFQLILNSLVICAQSFIALAFIYLLIPILGLACAWLYQTLNPIIQTPAPIETAATDDLTQINNTSINDEINPYAFLNDSRDKSPIYEPTDTHQQDRRTTMDVLNEYFYKG